MTQVLRRAAFLSFLFALCINHGYAQSVNWTPGQSNVQLFPGGVRFVKISFESESALTHVQVLIVPELQPFVSANPNEFAAIGAGETQNLTLTVRMPLTTPVSTLIQGTVRLRASRATIARPLPVTLEVVNAQPAINLLETFLVASFGTLRIPSPRLRVVLPPDVSAAFKAGTDGLIVLTHESPDLFIDAGSFTPNPDLKLAVNDLLTEATAKGIKVDDLRATLESNLQLHKNIDDTGGTDVISLFSSESGLYVRPAPIPNLIPPFGCELEYNNFLDFEYLVNCGTDGHIVLTSNQADELISVSESNGSFTQPDGELLDSASSALHEMTHAMIFQTGCFNGSVAQEELVVEDLTTVYQREFFGIQKLLAIAIASAIADGGSDCLELLGLLPPLLGTDMPTTSNAEIAVASFQFLAQQFTLTTAVRVSRISVQMSGFGTDQFTLWVTNSIGPATTLSNVFLQTDLTFPNTGGGTSGQTVSTTTNLTLTPGTYFLVLSATQTSVAQGWITRTTVLPSTVGSISNQALSTFFPAGSTNTLFPPASTFLTPEIFPLAFQMFGAPLSGQ